MSRTRVDAVRLPDGIEAVAGRHVAVRRFSLDLTTGPFTTPPTLAVDRDGLPVTLELVFQQGVKRFRRVE